MTDKNEVKVEDPIIEAIRTVAMNSMSMDRALLDTIRALIEKVQKLEKRMDDFGI